MARVCTICRHPEREAIDRALVERSGSYRTIADHYGLSETSLKRHRKDHIPAAVAEAKDAADIVEAGSLLAQVEGLRDRSLQLLGKAEQAGDLRTALQGIREARACIELLLEVEGELKRGATVNVTLSPEWLEIRAVVLESLHGHPEARQSVAGALTVLEEGRNAN